MSNNNNDDCCRINCYFMKIESYITCGYFQHITQYKRSSDFSISRNLLVFKYTTRPVLNLTIITKEVYSSVLYFIFFHLVYYQYTLQSILLLTKNGPIQFQVELILHTCTRRVIYIPALGQTKLLGCSILGCKKQHWFIPFLAQHWFENNSIFQSLVHFCKQIY